MSLNKAKGAMYPWKDLVTHTYNPIAGCMHGCRYCYLIGIGKRAGRDMFTPCFRENYLEDVLSGKAIFVGSSGDMWGQWVGDDQISDVLIRCRDFELVSEFLFQSKNPARFMQGWNFPVVTTLCTTIETNRSEQYQKLGISRAPDMINRAIAMSELSGEPQWRTMVNVEPVIDFDLDKFVHWFRMMMPRIVSFGADSRRGSQRDLPEPPMEKLVEFIQELKKIVPDVRLKPNLQRIIPPHDALWETTKGYATTPDFKLE